MVIIMAFAIVTSMVMFMFLVMAITIIGQSSNIMTIIMDISKTQIIIYTIWMAIIINIIILLLYSYCT